MPFKREMAIGSHMPTNRIKKIIFIEPKSPGYHIYSKWALPRLGTLILGTILKNHGYDVKIFIEEIKGININEIFEADAVGISTITPTAPRAYEMARQIKKLGIPVFMGGPHVTFMPAEALKYCDYVLRGETEETINDFIKFLEDGKNVEKIKGLSYKIGHHVVHNEVPPHCLDLDNFPIPDFTLIHGYEKSKAMKAITPIMTSRGCPFGCNFCSVTQMFGRRYRFRSCESVIEELKIRQPEWVFFYDDNFTANRERTKTLLTKMIERKITPPWSAQVRVDIAKDKELMELMQKSNCAQVYIGFESINPKTLEFFNKNQSLDEIKNAIRIIHQYKIKIHGMFITGAEHDDIHTIRETVKFAKKMKIESVQFVMLTPLPGTTVFKELDAEGRLISYDWSYYDGHHVVFKPKKMSFLDLQTETLRAMLKFYSFPQILKALNQFDLWTMVIRAYGRWFLRKWKINNIDFIEHLKHIYKQAGKEIHSAGQKTQLRASKTAEDIKEAFSKFWLSRNGFRNSNQNLSLK